MRIFKKKSAIETPVSCPEEMAARIAAGIIRAQTRIAGYLNVRTNKLPKKAQLIILLLFSLLFSAINIYLLI